MVCPIILNMNRRPLSSLRKLKSRFKANIKVNVKSEAKPKRRALKLNGEKSVKAVLTTEKFIHQIKLVPINIKSVTVNGEFEERLVFTLM